MERFFPAESIVMTGNPVRKGLTDITLSQAEAKTQLGFDPDKQLVLFVGGSLGARTINESVAASLDSFIAAGIQILWQTGKNYDGDARLKSLKDNSGVKATPFISDMDVVYRAADLVVSRAGAGSISELQSLGKAVVLVPSPNVAEDHQRKNALALVSHNAAVMIEDAECRSKLADTVISLIGDAERRKTLSDNISRMALKDSDELIVDTIIDIINSENK